MHVAYSIGGSTFGGGGIGRIAYHAVAGVFRHNLLKQVIVSDYRHTEIPETMISRIPSHIRGLRQLVGPRLANEIQDRLHGLFATGVLRDAEIFHGWAGMSSPVLGIAKRHGSITVLERASSHVLEQKEILGEEARQRKITFAAYTQSGIERECKEYEIADYILTPSSFARESFIKRGFAAEKILQIPFGIDLNAASEKASFRKPDAPLNAIFVGEVGFRKGILYALKAWQKAQFKKGTFFVLGPIIDEIRPFLGPFERDTSIVFTGFVNPDEYYQQSDVFIFPSLEEGSALVTYEAMAHRLPLIVTHNAGSVIEDGSEGCVVEPRDVNSIIVAIERLATNHDLRLHMSEAAWRKVQEYSWFEYGEKIVRMYQNICHDQ